MELELTPGEALVVFNACELARSWLQDWLAANLEEGEESGEVPLSPEEVDLSTRQTIILARILMKMVRSGTPSARSED